jgi:tetratricopeptide (TPR) repeat protein
MYLILSDLAPLDDARQEVARIFEKNGEKNRDKLTLKRVEDVCEAIKDKVEITKSQFQAIIFANRDNKEFLKDFADRFRNESSANKKQYYRLLVDLLRVRGTPPLYEFAGDLAFHNTNYNSALVHYKNSLSLSDRNGVVLHKMGIAHLENKKPLMAQKYLAAALLLRSDDSSIKYNMARALTLQGKLSDAESVIRQAWTDWPASRELYQSDPDFNKLRKYLHNQFVSH